MNVLTAARLWQTRRSPTTVELCLALMNKNNDCDHAHTYHSFFVISSDFYRFDTMYDYASSCRLALLLA